MAWAVLLLRINREMPGRQHSHGRESPNLFHQFQSRRSEAALGSETAFVALRSVRKIHGNNSLV